MAESIYDVLWAKSIIGLAKLSVDGKFLAANPSFCNMLGYSEAELQVRTWKDITHPEDVAGFLTMFNRAVIGEITSFTGEKRFLTKRGNLIWCMSYVTAIKNEDSSVNILLKQVLCIPSTSSIPYTTTVKEIENTNSSKEEDNSSKEEDKNLKGNYKLILAAVIGCIMALVGAMIGNEEIKNLGIALTIGIFGGSLVKPK